jgi:hypothetical protein
MMLIVRFHELRHPVCTGLWELGEGSIAHKLVNAVDYWGAGGHFPTRAGLFGPSFPDGE